MAGVYVAGVYCVGVVGLSWKVAGRVVLASCACGGVVAVGGGVLRCLVGLFSVASRACT